MLVKRREEKDTCTAQIENIKNIDAIVRKRKKEFNQSKGLIDDIILDSGISDTNLRMLIDQIVIKKGEKGLQIAIDIKAKFAMHLDTYDKDGEVKDKSFEMMAGGLHSNSELIKLLD